MSPVDTPGFFLSPFDFQARQSVYYARQSSLDSHLALEPAVCLLSPHTPIGSYVTVRVSEKKLLYPFAKYNMPTRPSDTSLCILVVFLTQALFYPILIL